MTTQHKTELAVWQKKENLEALIAGKDIPHLLYPKPQPTHTMDTYNHLTPGDPADIEDQQRGMQMLAGLVLTSGAAVIGLLIWAFA